MQIPCIRGKMGSTVFYQAVMPANDLVYNVKLPDKKNRWAFMGIEERFHSEPHMQRIKSELVPYLENSPDRFFGSLIVLINSGYVEFSSYQGLDSAGTDTSGSDRFGVLTLEGSELIVLDGQHRLLALRQIIKPLRRYDVPVKDDDVSVVFIEHETIEKTRKIFSSVNRHVKPPGRSEHLIMDDSDAYAVIARRLLNEGEPLGVSDWNGDLMLVNWKHHTLSARSRQFTTLSTVYETVTIILKHKGKPPDWHTREDISEEEMNTAYGEVKEFWQIVIEYLNPLRLACTNPNMIPLMRQPEHPYSLLLKPVGQVALFQGLAIATDEDHQLPLIAAVERANAIDWRMTAEQWKGNLVRSRGIVETRLEPRNKASSLIAYLIAADRMSEEEKKNIERIYNSGATGQARSLPKSVAG